RAEPGDRVCRSQSTAVSPASLSPRVPCAPAASPSTSFAAPTPMPLLHHTPRRLPTAFLLPLPSPPPLPLSPLHAHTAPTPPLPTRSEILGSSPADPFAPGTPGHTPSFSSPHLLSCTAAPLLAPHTGPV